MHLYCSLLAYRGLCQDVSKNNISKVANNNELRKNRKLTGMNQNILGVLNLAKKKNEINIRSSAAEYLTYVAAIGDQEDSIEMRYEDENIWLTQKMMSILYDVDVRTVSDHIQKVYSDFELDEKTTIRKFRIVQAEGSRQVSREVNHYNLQMIIAVGFKVNNERAVQFRKWTNGIVKDYTIKGWVIDDERLKNGGSVLTVEYFDRLLEQIREIRLSERRFYQKITDIYATSLDYDRTAGTTKQFFSKVQNKMHYAVHGHTAAELIYERADAEKPHMGLTTWAAAPAGKITAEIAKSKAETEFEKYRIIQDRLFMSDYDRYLLELEENTKK